MKPTESEVLEEIRCLRELRHVCEVDPRPELNSVWSYITAQLRVLDGIPYYTLDGLCYSYAHEANRWLNEGGQRPSETWMQLKILGLD